MQGYIGQNVRLLEEVSFYTKNNNLPGILFSINLEKAVVSLYWNFLFKTENFNFGEIFINYIKKELYNNGIQF